MAEDFYLDWQCTEPDRARQMALCWFMQSIFEGKRFKPKYRIVHGTGWARRLTGPTSDDTAQVGPLERITVTGITSISGFNFYGTELQASFVFDHTVRDGVAANRLITLTPADLADSAIDDWRWSGLTGWAVSSHPADWGKHADIDADSRTWVYWDGCEVASRRYSLDSLEGLLYVATHWFCPSLSRGERFSDSAGSRGASDNPHRLAAIEAEWGESGLDPRFETAWRARFAL